MNLAELIAQYRIDAHDTAVPYFASDASVTSWLNEAQDEAVIRGRLIHESESVAVCQIALEAGKSVYPLHEALYEIDHAAFRAEGSTERTPVYLTSSENLDRILYGWRDRGGIPKFAVQDDGAIRLVPAPSQTGTLILEGYRLPLADMVDPEDSPEINGAHHRHLVNWALYRAFSIPDGEMIDPNRAALAERSFIEYFGLRPDCDLRRITREDTPHHNEAFFV